MGFHLVTRVYEDVSGTSPTAQAVLAYLAHRADDAFVRPCHPSKEQVMAATHFGRSAVTSALAELKQANLLSWEKGGRILGAGGRALANAYHIRLPAHAWAGKRPMHRPPDGPHQPISSPSQISVAADVDKSEETLAAAGRAWMAVQSRAEERAVLRRAEGASLVREAMRVCKVADTENCKIFSFAMLGKDRERCLEEILCFESELRNGEHARVHNLAAILTKRLGRLPQARHFRE